MSLHVTAAMRMLTSSGTLRRHCCALTRCNKCSVLSCNLKAVLLAMLQHSHHTWGEAAPGRQTMTSTHHAFTPLLRRCPCGEYNANL